MNAHSNHSHSQHSTVLVLSLSLALSAHSVAAFYLPPEPCVSYEPRKATDSTLPPTAAAAGSGASSVFGGAVGSTAHDADTTHASNILLSVVGHSRRGDSQQRRREEEGRPKQLCSVFTLGGQLELKSVLAGGWDTGGEGMGAAGAACLRHG